MPLPQIGGTVTMRHSGDNTAILDISGVPVGGWMIVSVMSSVSSLSLTPPSGWSILHAREVSGTRSNFLFAKIKVSADGNTATFTQGVTTTIAYGLIWGTGGADIATWTAGNSWVRASSGEPSGARYTNIAPGITTPSNDQLVLAFSNEATNAFVQTNEVTNVTSGWTQRMYLPQVAANDRIETLWVGSKEMTTAGATGNVSVTYVSAVDNNGWGMQVAIPSESVPVVQTPQVVGTPATTILTSASETFSVNRPTGVINGDYVVVAVRGQASNTTVEPSSSGFTRLGPAFIASSSSYRTNGLYGRPVTNISTEPSSYTFTFSSGSGRIIATAFIVRGVDLSNPISGYFDNYGGSTVTGGRQVDSYTLAKAPALALFYAGAEFAASSDHVPVTSPAGYTQFSSADSSGGNISSSRTYLWLGTQVFTDVYTVPARSITWGNPASPAAEGIAFNGSTSAPANPVGNGYSMHNGNAQVVKTYYTTSDGPRTPSAIVPMRRGFTSVTDMLAKPGFTWAHRGGSASYPEHSLYAYTQSVARGYGVLEVSLGRTSDGVWFGLHNQTTDYTSGGTFGNASSQTWAQIQAQQIVVGPQGAPQPYMRWSELVAKYGKTHIIVADPKYALGSYRTEFLNMVNTDLGPTRAIIKYSGSGSGAAALSTAAQAMGFQTWGFFYAADASSAQGGSGALQTWGPSWTLIGMEYGASQAIWNECLALGKPVIGHIAPDQAAYNTAISKGASGVQVSGVGVVEPVSWWTQPRYPSIIGVATSSRTGAGNLTVTLPSQAGGCYMILLVGDNASTQPATPAGWTLVNWSTGNPNLNMGIYAAGPSTSAPTFSLAQSHNGGFVATAFRFDVDAITITGSGGNNTLTSSSMVAPKPGLMLWSMSGVLSTAPPANYTFPLEAPVWRRSIVSAGTEGGVALGVAAATFPTGGAVNSVTWGLDNQSSTRAGGFFIALP